MKHFLVAASAVVISAAPVLADEWGYTGEHGPENWGGACLTGAEQSPIDLAGAIEAEVPTPELNWNAESGRTLVNTGHGVQVNFAEGGTMRLGGTDFTLLQYHFHTPSEHTLDGEAFPMEVHFVHASEEGALAVFGVFFTEGEANAALDPLIANLPEAGDEFALVEGGEAVAFLPEDGDVFRYAGSLTTPPCSEVVAWSVIDTPVEASAEQLAAMQALFGDNARPVQPLNRRYLLIAE